MRKSRFKESQIVGILKEVESGRTGQEVCREHGISEHTLYRWKKTYGGMEVSDAKRLRELEETNSPSDSLHEWTDFGGRSPHAIQAQDRRPTAWEQLRWAVELAAILADHREHIVGMKKGLQDRASFLRPLLVVGG